MADSDALVIGHPTDDRPLPRPTLRVVNAPRSPVCPVIVGRDDLLDLADRRIREVAAGSGRVLLLAGEAGLGKTRLAGAIERRAAASGFRTVRGGTFPSDLQVPAAILIDLARAMARATADDVVLVGSRLEHRLEEDDQDAAGDPHRRRRLLVLDIADILVGLVDGGPTLVVLEDLHCSDDLTLEVLEALARRVPALSLLVVGTYRSDESYPRVPVRHWRARLLASRLVEEVRLARLGVADTATMVALLGRSHAPAARDVVAAMHERTDGIPLHVEELMAQLADVDVFDADDVRHAEVPDTVESAITARLAQRSPEAAVVARAGAVIGRAFDLDLLAAVVDQPTDALSAPLEELAAHFVLMPSRVPGRFTFRHALICDVVYDSIAVPERRRLHARVADAAAPRPDVGTDAFLCLHYERAGQAAKAFRSACSGAATATAISSHGEARALLECALRTAPADLGHADRAPLLEAYARSAAAMDDNAAAADAFEAARAGYVAAGMRLEAAAVVAPLVDVRHLLGDDLDTRADRLRAALAGIAGPWPGDDEAAGRARDRVHALLSAALAAALMLARRLDDAITVGLDARERAALAGSAPIERHAAATLGACYAFAGRMDDGWPLLEDVVQASRSGHLEAEAARAYRMIGSSASVLVEYSRAEAWLREGIEYSEHVGLWNHRHYMAAHLGHVLWATGRWDEAQGLAHDALADGRGGITTRITALHVLGYVAFGRGDLRVAETILGEALDLGQRMAEIQRLSPALWGLAETALAAASPANAARLSEDGLAASLGVEDAAYLFPFVVTGVRAYLALGDPAAARDWLGRVRRPIEHRGIPGTLPSIEHAAGLLLLADGDTAKARASLTAAAEQWAALGRIWEGTWALVDLARCERRSNRRPEAARSAATAAETARRIGAPAVGEAAAAAGARSERLPRWAPLTARQFEVARLVADGSTNGEIAEMMGLTRKTVASHVEHILTKLDVGRRAEIAAWVAVRTSSARVAEDDRSL